MIVLLLAIVALYLLVWLTSELPELGVAIVVAVPIIQALI